MIDLIQSGCLFLPIAANFLALLILFFLCHFLPGKSHRKKLLLNSCPHESGVNPVKTSVLYLSPELSGI